MLVKVKISIFFLDIKKKKTLRKLTKNYPIFGSEIGNRKSWLKDDKRWSNKVVNMLFNKIFSRKKFTKDSQLLFGQINTISFYKKMKFFLISRRSATI